jgi:DNA modification methylase
MEAMKEMPDKAFDLAIVDPPYGIGMHGGSSQSKYVLQKNGSRIYCNDGGYVKKEWDKEPPTPEYFSELQRVSRDQIIWGMNYHPVLLRGGAIIWDKVKDNSGEYSKAEIAYCSMHDTVQIFRFMWNGMMQGLSMFNGTTQQGNKALNEKRIHPTQKPVELYKWLLTNYAEKGWKILDTHFGSLSIGIACHDLGYDLTAFEIDLEYYEGGKTRLEEHQRQGRLFDAVSV